LLFGSSPSRLLSVANKVPPEYANPPIAPKAMSLAAVGTPGKGATEAVGMQFAVWPAGQGACEFTPPEFWLVNVVWPITARAACPVINTWALPIPANRLIDSKGVVKYFCMRDD